MKDGIARERLTGPVDRVASRTSRGCKAGRVGAGVAPRPRRPVRVNEASGVGYGIPASEGTYGGAVSRISGVVADVVAAEDEGVDGVAVADEWGRVADGWDEELELAGELPGASRGAEPVELGGGTGLGGMAGPEGTPGKSDPANPPVAGGAGKKLWKASTGMTAPMSFQSFSACANVPVGPRYSVPSSASVQLGLQRRFRLA